MRTLKRAVEAACGGGVAFNSCLLNLYRDGSDHVPWHADDEPVYGDLTDCTIASVSLGASRLFQIRQNPIEDTGDTHAAAAAAPRWKYTLHSGSLLVMRGATQRHYQHRVPKRERRPVGARINATFRTFSAQHQTQQDYWSVDQSQLIRSLRIVLGRPFVLSSECSLCCGAQVQSRSRSPQVNERQRCHVQTPLNKSLHRVILQSYDTSKRVFAAAGGVDAAHGEAGSGSDEDDVQDDEAPGHSAGSSEQRDTQRDREGPSCAVDSVGSRDQHIRFAARRLSARLFVGHGRKKLCTRGAAVLQERVRDAAARAVAFASSAPAKLQSLHHVEDDVGSLLSEISLQATAGGDVISEHAQCHTHVAVTLETHRGYAFANLRCGHELASAAEHENTDPAAVTNLVQSLFLPLPPPPPTPPPQRLSLSICLRRYLPLHLCSSSQIWTV